MFKLESLPTSKSLRSILNLYIMNLTNTEEFGNGRKENHCLCDPVEGIPAAKALADKITQLLNDLDHPDLPFSFYERMVERAFALMGQANALLSAGGI